MLSVLQSLPNITLCMCADIAAWMFQCSNEAVQKRGCFSIPGIIIIIIIIIIVHEGPIKASTCTDSSRVIMTGNNVFWHD